MTVRLLNCVIFHPSILLHFDIVHFYGDMTGSVLITPAQEEKNKQKKQLHFKITEISVCVRVYLGLFSSHTSLLSSQKD